MFDKFGIEPEIRCQWDNDEQAIAGVLHSDSWAMVPDYIVERVGKSITTLPLPRGWEAPYTIAAVIRPHRADNQTLLHLIERMRAVLASGAKDSGAK